MSTFNVARADVLSLADNYTKMLCLFSDTKCPNKKMPQALQLKIQTCQALNKSPMCQKFIKEEPEFAFSLQDCTPQQFCKDQLWQEVDSLKACKDGFLIGTGENFTHMIDAASNLWSNIEKNGAEKMHFLKACEPSIQCRVELAKNVPRYKDTSPAELMKLPIIAIYTARYNYDSYGDMKMEGARTQLERLKKERAEGKSSPKKNDTAMFKAAEDWLQKKMIRLECVDKKTQMELKCWGAAYILDPTLVAGAAAKVPTVGGRLFAKLSGAATEVTAKSAANGALLREALPAFERRATSPRIVPGGSLVGTRVETLEVVPNLPNSIAIAKYRDAEGVERVMMEKAVKTSSGTVQTVVREIHIDPLTGAVDANSSGGKVLLDSVLKANNGKSTLAFIDVNNLGYVNKNFTGKSIAGDEYLKNVGAAVHKATDGKAQFYKLGGDEFGLVINETDPKKVQAILDKVIKEVYSPSVNATFKSEKVAQAVKFKNENGIVNMSKSEKAAFAKNLKDNPDANSIRQFAPYSKEGISVGSTRVGRGEGLEVALTRAEEQAKQMKIVTKQELNISAKKYGGLEAEPARKANLKYEPKAKEPVAGVDLIKTNVSSPSLRSSKGLADETRDQEVYRIGDVSVVSYTNQSGQKVTRFEKYSEDTAKGPQHINPPKQAPEVNMNEKTGLIDSTKGVGAKVANLAIHAQGPEKSMIWINAENLGKVNYFEKGTGAGDELLTATSQVIQREVGKSGIPFKGHGSEFTVALNGLTDQQVNNLDQRIAQALAADPKVKQIFAEQKITLQTQLVKAFGDSKKIAEIKEKLTDLEKIKPTFTIRSTSKIPDHESMDAIVSRIKK